MSVLEGPILLLRLYPLPKPSSDIQDFCFRRFFWGQTFYLGWAFLSLLALRLFLLSGCQLDSIARFSTNIRLGDFISAITVGRHPYQCNVMVVFKALSDKYCEEDIDFVVKDLFIYG